MRVERDRTDEVTPVFTIQEQRWMASLKRILDTLPPRLQLWPGDDIVQGPLYLKKVNQDGKMVYKEKVW